ncbi:hypothetical protein BG10_3070 [Bacillus thuringiensis serovar morrisoni]|uniref:hypothetical protein n=1 Tax=Bacillus thuringiensis TaxID=1428 RepID=UPI0005B6DF5C|nr:hypothetical protein [Bacillus thuringiensis]KIP25164.1 hypothetical protein BG10_3070 [Bacillus thuringiensis serovar morrisoni]MED2078590.1 hypothetical protein [Bacillus thuringiensis]
MDEKIKKLEKENEELKKALFEITDLQGNPTNPQEGCIIAREAKTIACRALNK